MRVLFIGDIFARPGRQAVNELLPSLRHSSGFDVVIANVENAAGGNGVTVPVIDEIVSAGVDVMTSGNHIWDKREGLELIEQGTVLRPANYPLDAPGVGSTVFRFGDGKSLGVISLQGRVFMKPIDCPFRAARREIERLRNETTSIFIDFHAEVTSEKVALGRYLDGDVSAIVGTHTHIATADEQILPEGTAYLTDAGMTGSHDSVIGVDAGGAMSRFISGLPYPRMEPAKQGVKLCGVIIEIEESSGLARSIERISLPLD
jgi:2',3'-cyclic-nucleotide 2'-phosphodiesterase